MVVSHWLKPLLNRGGIVRTLSRKRRTKSPVKAGVPVTAAIERLEDRTLLSAATDITLSSDTLAEDADTAAGNVAIGTLSQDAIEYGGLSDVEFAS